MEICRIECRNALIKRLTCMYGPGWSNSLANVSAIFLMLRSRILEGSFPIAAKRDKPCTAKPRKRLRRKTKEEQTAKVSYDQRAGGGGAQRAFLSTWLRGRKSAAGPTKKQRKKAISDLFTAGNKAYQDCLSRGGVEVERLKCVGAAGAQACSAGAAAFGGLKKRGRPDGQSAGPPALRRRLALDDIADGTDVDNEQIVGLADHARTTLLDFARRPSEVRRAKAKEHADDLTAVANASREMLVASCDVPVWSSIASQEGISQVKQAPPDCGFALNVFRVTPPAQEIGKRVLRAARGKADPLHDAADDSE